MEDNKPKKRRKKTGPRPDKLQSDGDWQEAVKKALKKPKPEDDAPDEKKSKD